MTCRPVPATVTLSQSEMPTYDATDLTQGQDHARIIYGDKVYTLRITRAGKLILTK